MSRQAVLRILLTAVVAVSAVGALGFDTWKVAQLTGRLSDQTHRLEVGLRAQNASRVVNVSVWCRAINAQRDYDRAFVRTVTAGRVRYALSDLPCRTLKLRTVASAPPPHPTK